MKAIFCSLFLFLISLTISAQQFDWVRTFWNPRHASTIIEDIETDSNGNVYSVGSFSDSLFFDSTFLPTHLDTSFHGFNINRFGFITKHDSSGNLIWTKSFVSSTLININSLKFDDLENVYLTGDFWGQADFNPSDTSQFILGDSLNQIGYHTFICKLNQQGEFV